MICLILGVVATAGQGPSSVRRSPNPAPICEKEQCEPGDRCQLTTDDVVHGCHYDQNTLACCCMQGLPPTQSIDCFDLFHCCQAPLSDRTTGTAASSTKTTASAAGCSTMLHSEDKFESAHCHSALTVAFRCCSPTECTSYCDEGVAERSHDVAVSFCQEKKLTLCTRNQAAAEKGEGGCGRTGCGFDAVKVWVRPDSCTDNDRGLQSAEADFGSWLNWTCKRAAAAGYCNRGTQNKRAMQTNCRFSCDRCRKSNWATEAPLGHHCNWVNPCEYPNDCLYNTSGIHLCSAYMRGNCTCVAPRAATLIKSSVECKSADVNLGATKDLFGCVQKCRKTPDCQFIVYGKGEKQGRCFWEKTLSRECVEGWENDLYDVYDINNGNVCTELRISNLKFTNGGVNLSGGMDDPFWGTVDVKCKLEVDSVSYTTSIKWESVRPDWGSRMWRFTPRSASSRLTIKCVDDDTHDASYDDDIGTYQAAVSALPRHVRSWIQSGDGEVYIEFDTQCLQGPNPASICDKKDCELGDHCQPMSDVSVRVSLHSCYYDNGACSCGYDQPSTSSEQRIMGFFYSYSFECCQPPNAETTGTPASSSSGNSGTEIPGV